MYTGTGIYSVQEASRLINVPSRDIRRWLFGYHYRKTPDEAASRVDVAPLWEHELAREEFDEDVIGFRDLVELRFIHEFTQRKVPLQVIRRCLATASEMFGVSHPMSLPRFKTDGRTIYAEALHEEQQENSMVDLGNRQSVFKDIIKPSLYESLEYDKSQQHASRWYPAGRKSPIVLDPARQFGAPIIDATGIPTNTLYQSYLAEGADTRALAITSRVYDVPAKVVTAAIRFEEHLKRGMP